MTAGCLKVDLLIVQGEDLCHVWDSTLLINSLIMAKNFPDLSHDYLICFTEIASLTVKIVPQGENFKLNNVVPKKIKFDIVERCLKHTCFTKGIY